MPRLKRSAASGPSLNSALVGISVFLGGRPFGFLGCFGTNKDYLTAFPRSSSLESVTGAVGFPPLDCGVPCQVIRPSREITEASALTLVVPIGRCA